MIELSDREHSNESPQDKSKQSMLMEYREGTANITDYSPEWAYPEVCLLPLPLCSFKCIFITFLHIYSNNHCCSVNTLPYIIHLNNLSISYVIKYSTTDIAMHHS